MAKLRNLREELQFNKDMDGIINVLKGVAASEFARLSRERKKFYEYEKNLRRLFSIVAAEKFSHCYVDENTALPSNIILMTSDSGFLGKLNILIVNSAVSQRKEGDLLTVIGRQGERYISEKTKEYKLFPGIDDYILLPQVEKLKNFIIKQVMDKRVSRTVIVYPEFISFAVQRVRSLQMLPCAELFLKKQETADEEEGEKRLIIEPSLKKVVEKLVSLWIGNVIYNIFWESKLSEWSARVMHLESSYDEVKRQARAVRLAYFRAVHEMSDRSIREIFSSTLALRGDSREKHGV